MSLCSLAQSTIDWISQLPLLCVVEIPFRLGHGGDELDSSLLLLPGLSALALYLLSVSDCTGLICDTDVSINWNLSLCVLV